MADDEPVDTASLLARLPPLPKVKNPAFDAQHIADQAGRGDDELLAELISGTFLDWMLDELLDALPDVRSRLAEIGPAGVRVQARPSNTVNALTVPTRDGIVIVYNLGFFTMLSEVSRTLALLIASVPGGGWLAHDAPADPAAGAEAITALAGLLDWVTSRAQRPVVGDLRLADEVAGFASNLAGRAQRLALCHELGHVLAYLDERDRPARPASVAGVAVNALADSWEKEYAADRVGLELYLRVLQAQAADPATSGRSVSSALLGAEVFLNTAAMLQENSAADAGTHPPADERLARLYGQFVELHPDPGLAAPARQLDEHVRPLRDWLVHEVRTRREQTLAGLAELFDAYDRVAKSAPADGLPADLRREVAGRAAHFLTDSPGATLDFLAAELSAPRGPDEQDAASARRLLALNGALHFTEDIRATVIPPGLSYS